MARENFHASVQYNDWKGTAAADDHDQRSLSRHLKQGGHINDGEILVGVDVFSGEVHEERQDAPIYVTALVAGLPGFDDLQAASRSGERLHLRRVRIEMSLNEFFGFFKRFNISISTGGVIDGLDIVVDE